MPLFEWSNMFWINGIKWKIKYVAPNSEDLRRSDGTLTIGVTDANVHTVFINNSLSEYMNRKCITHELVHCICFSYDIDIPIEQEEYMADFVANYGYEIIDIVEMLLSKIRTSIV